jgi:hypothetical protein
MVSTQETYRKIGWRDESLSHACRALESRVSINFGRSAALFRLTPPVAMENLSG